ncbi:MAG TPA: hypothetical protein VJ912_00330 [Candidatus Nanoarchaeia archaeon]|nr:hypothetical protein [Candidatus Nanoarchaeia archaeon]
MCKTNVKEFLENLNNTEIKLSQRLRKVEKTKNKELLEAVAKHVQNPSLRKRAVLCMDEKSKDFIKERIENEKNEGVLKVLHFKLRKLDDQK